MYEIQHHETRPEHGEQHFLHASEKASIGAGWSLTVQTLDTSAVALQDACKLCAISKNTTTAVSVATGGSSAVYWS